MSAKLLAADMYIDELGAKTRRVPRARAAVQGQSVPCLIS